MFPLSDSLKNFFSLLLSVLAIGFAMGAAYPLVTLTMHRNGFSATSIGFIAACYAAASIFAPLFAGKTMAWMGIRRSIISHTIVISGCMLAYPFAVGEIVWAGVRFLHGYAVNALFTISEYYVNILANSSNRGKILGLYIALLSAGFSVGPLLLLIMGSSGMLPYLAIICILLLSSISSVFLLRDQVQTPLHESQIPRLWVFRVAPHVMLAGSVYGAVEIIVFSLAPVYLLRQSYSEQMSALVLSVFTMGNVFFQIPIGFLCHRVAPVFILLVLTVMSGICGGVLAFAVAYPPLFYVIMFILGGAICGLYTTALFILGSRFEKKSLISANATFALVYSIGALLGPFLGGLLVDSHPRGGFPFIITSVCFAYFLLVCPFVKKERELPLNQEG